MNEIIIVPPGPASDFLESMAKAGFEAPGLTVLSTSMCPPDKAFLLHATLIPKIEPRASMWDLIEAMNRKPRPEDAYRGMTFSIDYPYAAIIRKRPKGLKLLWLRIRSLWWELQNFLEDSPWR